jgi:hypothetical protein
MSIVTIFLNHEHREALIKRRQGFFTLRLTNAEFFLHPTNSRIRAIELILKNESTKFTAFSNLLPGSNKFNCFDLLETAKSIPALKTENFQILSCSLQKLAKNEPFEVKLTFDIRSVQAY